MIRFEKLTVPETIYPFQDVVTAAEYKNGMFGTVADGTFTVGAGEYCIMQVEQGDDAKTDQFKIPAGSHARVAKIDKTVGGLILNITADNIAPATWEDIDAGNVLVAQSSGLLGSKGSAAAAGDIVVLEVTDYGVRAEIKEDTASA